MVENLHEIAQKQIMQITCTYSLCRCYTESANGTRSVRRLFPGECNYRPIYTPSFFYAAFIFSKVFLCWNEAWQWSVFMNTIKTHWNCLPYAPPCSGCPSKWLQIRRNASLVFPFDFGVHSKSTYFEQITANWCFARMAATLLENLISWMSTRHASVVNMHAQYYVQHWGSWNCFPLMLLWMSNWRARVNLPKW